MAAPSAQLGAALGLRLARLGSAVREESLARSTPGLVKVAADIADAMASRRADAARTQLVAWLEANASTSPLPPIVGSLFGALGRLGGFLAQNVFGTAIGFGVGSALTSVLEPYFTDMAVAAWRSNPVKPLSPETLAAEVARGLHGFDAAAEQATSTGINGERFRRLVELARVWPTLGELAELVNRGQLTDDEAVERLTLQGISADEGRRMIELRRRVPPATDVIRFAVREVYNPPARQAFGYDAEFPTDALPDAERAGITADDLEKYWVAHWDLPSPTQGFEMFHRGLIPEGPADATRPTLAGLLKALDVAPAWRELLTGIAYNVPGRIDLRRMYAEGVVDRDRVLRGYLDLGYQPTDAEILTDFATALAAAPERDLAKTEIVTLFEGRYLTEARAVDLLTELGYAREQVDAILALADARRLRAAREQVIRTVRARFVARKITETDAVTALDDLGLATGARDALLDLWAAERDATTRDLTPAELRSAFRAALISAEEYRGRLGELGYDAREVDLLFQLASR